MIGILQRTNAFSTAAHGVRRLGILILAATTLSVSVTFAEEPSFELDIPAQDLNSALKSLAVETDRQVLFSAAVVNGYKSPALNGEYSTAEALGILLADSDLTYDVTESNVLLVKAADSNERGASDSKNSELAPALIIRNPNQSASAGTSSRSESNAEQYESDTDGGGDSRGLIETIVVVGSRNAGIRRYEDDTQPYVVITADDIQSSFAGNIEELLRTQLTQNGAIRASGTSGFSNDGNRSRISLRGLGSDQTLILVDGRRLPRVSRGTRFEQSDINGIPLSAVERIEVLPSTASGIYGGGATGGVVNIVLRREYAGGELNVRYDNTFDTDTAVKRIEGIFGAGLEGGRTNFMVSASYSSSNPLLIGDRDFAARSRLLQLQNNPDAFLANPFSPPAASLTNIAARPAFDFPHFLETGEIRFTAPDLVFDDGTPLGSSRTHVPTGYVGVSSDGGAALQSNSGSFDYGLPNSIGGLRSSLINNPTTSSISLNIRREMTESLDFFIDTSYFRNEGRILRANVPTRVTLAADAPNNPFQQAIVVSFPAVGLQFEETNTSESRQVTGGFSLQLPRKWAMNADYQWSQSAIKREGPGSVLSAAGQEALASGTLDVIRDLNGSGLDVTGFLRNLPTEIDGPQESTQRIVALRTSGPLLTIAGGDVALSAIIENREETLEAAFFDRVAADDSGIVVFTPENEETVDSFYLEVLAPVFSTKNSRAGLELLEFQLAARHDSYSLNLQEELSDTGGGFLVDSRQGPLPSVSYQELDFSSTDITTAIRYSPVESLILRTSWGTGFLPPQINQTIPLFRPDFPVRLRDPKRGNTEEVITVGEVFLSGSRDIKPEKSESWSAGLVFEPKRVDGMRIALDYTRIEKEDEISSAGSQFIVDNEDDFSSRVGRGPLSQEDEALGYTAGPIQRLDLGPVNIAKSTVEAFDLRFDYEWNLGDFGALAATLNATYQKSLRSQITSESPEVERVDFVDGPLEWRAAGGLRWEGSGPYSLGWNFTHYGSQKVTFSSLEPTDPRNLDRVLSQGGSRLPSRTYHDIFARLDFDGFDVPRWFRGGILQLGIQNVFDTSPVIIASTNPAGLQSPYGDYRMRRYSIQYRVDF